MPMVVRRHSSGACVFQTTVASQSQQSGGQRPAQASVGVLVPLSAGHPPSVGAVAGLRRVGSAPPCHFAHRPGMHEPQEGAVKVANMAGCIPTDSGTPLPPASPARTSWYSYRQLASTSITSAEPTSGNPRLNRSLIRPEPLKHRALQLVLEITAA